MEIKPVVNLLTASARRARSRAVELSKKRKTSMDRLHRESSSSSFS